MSAIQQMLAGGAAVFSAWNPSDLINITLSNGNKTATTATANGAVRGVASRSSGKFYFEITGTSVVAIYYIGIASSTHVLSTTLGGDTVSAAYRNAGDIVYNNASFVAAATFTNGDVIGFAIDVTNHLMYCSKNGTWQNSAVPSSGTGGVDYITTAPVFPSYYDGFASDSATLNTGATAFAYTPPSGFSAWG